jgi:glucans biosynthesis protein C
VEAALLLAGTFALSFAGYEAVRRVPLLRPLFGLKRRASGSTAAPTSPVVVPR